MKTGPGNGRSARHSWTVRAAASHPVPSLQNSGKSTILSLLFFILSPVLLCGADGWALSSPEKATRQVVVTLSFKKLEVERWTFPVAENAAEVSERIRGKWIVFPEKPNKDMPIKIFTDTWLGSVIDKDVYLRFSWWRNVRRTDRVFNNYLVVPYGATNSWGFGKDLLMEVCYGKRSNTALVHPVHS